MGKVPLDVTGLLGRMAQGDPEAANELFPAVYRELRRIAARHLRNERSNHTLQPTALVNELWLRWAGQAGSWQDRKHFFAMASNAMRQILVDAARKRKAQKRGSGGIAIELEAAPLLVENRLEDMIAVHQALTRLHKQDERQAGVVEMRYFLGLTEEEIALILHLDERTVKRDWSTARGVLKIMLGEAKAASAD